MVNNNDNKEDKMKDKKQIILWVLIAVLAILVLYVVFAQSGGSIADTISPSTQAAQNYAGMVGGC